MNLWIIAIVIGALLIAGIVISANLETANATEKVSCANCQGTCNAEKNCGLASCQAVNGGKCGCGG